MAAARTIVLFEGGSPVSRPVPATLAALRREITRHNYDRDTDGVSGRGRCRCSGPRECLFNLHRIAEAVAP